MAYALYIQFTKYGARLCRPPLIVSICCVCLLRRRLTISQYVSPALNFILQDWFLMHSPEGHICEKEHGSGDKPDPNSCYGTKVIVDVETQLLLWVFTMLA